MDLDHRGEYLLPSGPRIAGQQFPSGNDERRRPGPLTTQSPIVRDGRTHVSMVCHIFTIEGNKVATIRTYRNEYGIPPG